jgi:hypothetical protein
MRRGLTGATFREAVAQDLREAVRQRKRWFPATIAPESHFEERRG